MSANGPGLDTRRIRGLFPRSRINQLFLALTLLVFADVLASVAYLHRVSESFEQSLLETTDVGIVFFADFDAAGGVGPETSRRVARTWKLYQARRFAAVICAGGARPDTQRYGSQAMALELSAMGVEPAALHTEMVSNDTATNLDAAFRLMDEHGYRDATLISSPLHMSRIRRIATRSSPPGQLVYSPYAYHGAVGWLELWKQCHYEWAAYILNGVLPTDAYRALVDSMRE